MSAFNSAFFNRVLVPTSFVSTLIGGIILLKEHKGGKKCPSKERMDGKVCVVTGASSGIGKCTAEELAKRGATVVMGCRHMGKCEKAARKIRTRTENSHVVCRFVDLASFDAIEEFAEKVRSEISHIDILINNAGVMKPRLLHTTLETVDNFDRQFGVNYLGHFLLTNLLLDRLTNGNDPGRVINVTSDAFKNGTINLEDLSKSDVEEEDARLTELYYQSKLAVVLFTDALSRKFAASPGSPKLISNCLHPGVTITNIGRYASVPVYAIGMHLFKPIQYIMMKTPVQGAQTSIYLSVDPDIKKSGGYYDDCEEVEETCNVCDSKLADELWEMSEKWTDLKNRMQRIQKNAEFGQQVAAPGT